MIFHWCQWNWQPHFALLQEISLLSLASFCQSRAVLVSSSSWFTFCESGFGVMPSVSTMASNSLSMSVSPGGASSSLDFFFFFLALLGASGSVSYREEISPKSGRIIGRCLHFMYSLQPSHLENITLNNLIIHIINLTMFLFNYLFIFIIFMTYHNYVIFVCS